MLMQGKHPLAGKHATLKFKTLWRVLDRFGGECTVIDYYSKEHCGASWTLSSDPICTEYKVRTLNHKIADSEKVVIVIYRGERMLVHESEIVPLPRKT